MSVVKRKIPHEVKDYESAMFFGLTLRQVVCVIIMAVLIIPTVFLNIYLLHLPSDEIGWIIMLEVIPPAACGWAKYNGMPIEQIAVKIFSFYFGSQRRKWKWENHEATVFEGAMKAQLYQWTEERKAEIEEEKQRKIEVKKARRHNRKKRQSY